MTTQKRKKTREFLLFGVKIDDPFLSGGVGSFKVFGVCPLSLATSYNIKDEEEEEEGKKDSEDFLSLIFCTRVHTLNRFGLFFDSVGLYVGTSRDHDERLNTLVVLFLYNTHV